MSRFNVLVFSFMFLCLATPALAVWDYNPSSAGSQDAQTKDEEPDPIKTRPPELIAYCKKLPKKSQPEKTCACLKDAYESSMYQRNKGRVGIYKQWVKKLDDVTKKLQTAEDPNLFGTVDQFCSRWFGDLDKIEAGNGMTRDEAVLKPKFKTEEEKIAYMQSNRELKMKSKGLSDQYCRANAEVAVYQRLLREDPFQDRPDSDVYQTLRFHKACHTPTH
ncbi:MAG: hypothetical protein H6858_02555 [Rhodospirillales bacterium]|nr:hypothetical protein [Alphaproteobacteria bacterium]MCB9976464.1 hypothetical protein [Rhodospirillales bacterium]